MLSRDDGVTLVELVVGMVLMTIVGAAALTFFVGTTHADSATADRTVSTSQARDALSTITQLLRVADSSTNPGTNQDRFERISPTDAIFYANLATRNGAANPSVDNTGAPVKIWLSLTGGKLIEKRFNPTNATTLSWPSYPSTPYLTRILATGVSAPPSDPVNNPNGWVFVPGSAADAPTVTEPSLCGLAAARTPGLCSISLTGGIDGTGAVGADAILQTIAEVDVNFTLTKSNGSTESYFSSVAISGQTT